MADAKQRVIFIETGQIKPVVGVMARSVQMPAKIRVFDTIEDAYSVIRSEHDNEKNRADYQNYLSNSVHQLVTIQRKDEVPLSYEAWIVNFVSGGTLVTSKDGVFETFLNVEPDLVNWQDYEEY